jgi:hypothetical protein
MAEFSAQIRLAPSLFVVKVSLQPSAGSGGFSF